LKATLVNRGEPMAKTATIQSAFTGMRCEVEVKPGLSVRQAVRESGLVFGDDFITCDMDAEVLDDHLLEDHRGEVINVSFPGPDTGPDG